MSCRYVSRSLSCGISNVPTLIYVNYLQPPKFNKAAKARKLATVIKKVKRWGIV